MLEITKPELVWKGKYDNDGNLKPIEKPGPFPFQIVEVINKPRTGIEEAQETLFEIWEGKEGNSFEEGWKNKLIWGDNKLVMCSLLDKFAGKINLIYIDPPFATGADFKFKIQVGENAEEITKEHSLIEEKAYRDTWGKGMDSYLQMMYERLNLMKELLADNGSIYVHLDWHVGHYVKVIMDEIFGYDNMINEVIWFFKGTTNSTSRYGDKHDTILYYSKNKGNHLFNADAIRIPFGDLSAYKKDDDGKLYKQWTKENKYYPPQDYINGEWILKGKFRYDVIDDVPSMATAHGDEYLGYSTQKKEDLLKIFIMASSNPGDLVADFFCGSGTTIAVAEKLGRRWIGCDLSRYAIHITRKRLLEIENSKDLENKEIKYGKKAQPFEILNLGKYERQIWQMKTFTGKDEKQTIYEYIAFILKLYGATPISGFTHIYGKKEKALVYVGAIDSPVTVQEVIDAIEECKQIEQKELHILGWEWEMGLNDAIQEIARKENITLKLRIIPKETMDPEAVSKGDIQFFELAHFKVDIKNVGKKVELELKDFVIPHTDLIDEEVKKKIKKWVDWVDYWAVDFDFKNDTFNNGWTSYRTKKNRNLNLKASHTYKDTGLYKIFVKVIDILGIDTSQVFEVEIK